MTLTETAQANLTGFYLGNGNQPYIDWSASSVDRVFLEVGDGDGVVQIDLTLDQLAVLHHRLGAYLAVAR